MSVPRSVSKRTNRIPGGDDLDRHDVLAGVLRRVDREEHVPVGRAGAQRLERAALAVGVVRHIDQRDRVAGPPRGGLGAAQHRPEERVRDVGDHEADRARRARAQRAGRYVGAVAELLGSAAHGSVRARGDPSSGLAGQHQRDRRLRHAGAARDIDARDSRIRSSDEMDTTTSMSDLVEEVVPLRGRDLRLMRPRDTEALLDEEAFDRDEFLPYWAELWPSSLALARMIAGRALRGARTLELGCGLGLPSIAAALAGGRVLATDWSPEAVAMTARQRRAQRSASSRRWCARGRRPARCSSARRGTSCSPRTCSTSPATRTRCSRSSRASGREVWLGRPRPRAVGRVPRGGAERLDDHDEARRRSSPTARCTGCGGFARA